MMWYCWMHRIDEGEMKIKRADRRIACRSSETT